MTATTSLSSVETMTEVLGVSVAILEAVEKCVRGSSSLLAEVKDVPVQLRSVLAELETLRLILTKVIEASQNGLLGGENAQMIERATKECASTVIELEDLLAGLVSKRGESGMSISKRLKFMLAGPKMDSIRSRLDRQRAVLEMILSIVSRCEYPLRSITIPIIYDLKVAELRL